MFEMSDNLCTKICPWSTACPAIHWWAVGAATCTSVRCMCVRIGREGGRRLFLLYDECISLLDSVLGINQERMQLELSVVRWMCMRVYLVLVAMPD